MSEVTFQPSQYDTPINEPGIFDQVRSGNIKAYSALYVRHAEDVFRFIFAQVPDPQVAEDLTEETFIKGWLTLQEQNFHNDQYKITLFQIASALVGEQQKTKSHPANKKTPRLLAKLPAPLRNLLILSYILEVSEEDISQILRIKQGLLKPLNQWALALLSLHLKAKKLNYHPVRWLMNSKDAFMPPEKFEQRSTGRLLELIKIMRLRQVHQSFKKSLKPAKIKPSFQFSKLAFQVITLLVVSAVMLFTSANVVFAAQGSLPGDTFYSAKLTLEGFQVAIKNKAEQKINLHIQYAVSRINEINLLADQGRFKDIGLALDNLNQHLGEVDNYLQYNSQGFSKHTGMLLTTLEAGLEDHLQLISTIQGQLSPQTQNKLAQQSRISENSLATINGLVDAGNTGTTNTRSGQGISDQGGKFPTNFSQDNNLADPFGKLKANNQGAKGGGKGTGNPHGQPPGQDKDKDKDNKGDDKGKEEENDKE
jgi:DNA-directed RNA polymerase specialized sigma24 family protein